MVDYHDVQHVNILSRPLKNALFCPISASGSNFDPRNTKCIPVVKILAFLDLEQNRAFFKIAFPLRGLHQGTPQTIAFSDPKWIFGKGGEEKASPPFFIECHATFYTHKSS
jgi:hypothetical protein